MKHYPVINTKTNRNHVKIQDFKIFSRERACALSMQHNSWVRVETAQGKRGILMMLISTQGKQRIYSEKQKPFLMSGGRVAYLTLAKGTEAAFLPSPSWLVLPSRSFQLEGESFLSVPVHHRIGNPLSTDGQKIENITSLVLRTWSVKIEI